MGNIEIINSIDFYLVLKEQNKYSYLGKLLAGIILLGLFKNTFSSNIIFSKEQISTLENCSNSFEKVKKNDKQQVGEFKNIITGIIIDNKTNLPIAYVVVRVKNLTIGTLTDLTGKFKINIPDSLVKKKFVLEIHCAGYENTELVIDKSNINTHNEICLIQKEEPLIWQITTRDVKSIRTWNKKNSP